MACELRLLNFDEGIGALRVAVSPRVLPSSVIAAATEQLLSSDSPLNQRKWDNRLANQRKAIFIIESLGIHPKPTNTPPVELRQTFAIITMLDVSA
jgi:hypothetical protein